MIETCLLCNQLPPKNKLNYTKLLAYHSAAVGGAVLAKYRALTSLKTKGLGPQNLISILLIFSWREASSRHHFE